MGMIINLSVKAMNNPSQSMALTPCMPFEVMYYKG